MILNHFLLYVTFLAGVIAFNMSRREMIKKPITLSLYPQSFPVATWASTGLTDSLKYILALFLISSTFLATTALLRCFTAGEAIY